MNNGKIFKNNGDKMDKKEKIFVIFIFLAVFAAFFFHFETKGDYVVILSDAEEYAAVPIDEDCEISVDGKNTVKIENGEVYVSYADCPDKLCMKQGKIGKNGGVIVCLPNKMTVKIENR